MSKPWAASIRSSRPRCAGAPGRSGPNGWTPKLIESDSTYKQMMPVGTSRFDGAGLNRAMQAGWIGASVDAISKCDQTDAFLGAGHQLGSIRVMAFVMAMVIKLVPDRIGIAKPPQSVRYRWGLGEYRGELGA